MVKVLVCGALGKMGSAAVEAVMATDDLHLVAVVDTGISLQSEPENIESPREFRDLAQAIAATEPDVMVDFTHPQSVEDNLAIALRSGVDCVVGTTGLSPDVLSSLAENAPNGTCLFFAPNFAVGAVLMMRFAAEAARFMPHVEIIELHHDQKADAPSGTALRTASLIAEHRSLVPGEAAVESQVLAGATGAQVDGIPVHSIRLPGLVAHQEVIFGASGQTLTIRHDSLDRTSFMPGVLLAVRKVGGLSGLIVGLETLMGD
ncbi:MAG: 4-hydroxy-tetrahydrodipicolinate reductase [Actinobacteria bacterium]|nr:4-hydroxy-tetrahydrodipicolinate reductase [Actinomycetota bacterium]MCL5887576.1 4-hydroxy-tetrahydrodipicolinate reductase [Actinomycetota bacterium]